jgi:hypothetical protein
MAGLLDGFGFDFDEIEAPSYDVPDDVYEFEVSSFYIRQGTNSKPDVSWIIIEYSLGDSGKTKSEWFQLPEDAANPTESELQKLGFYKSRMMDLGFESNQIGNVGPDDVVGITGTLQVFTKSSKNGPFQNIKNVKVNSDDQGNQFSQAASPEPAEEPAAPAAKKAPARTAPQAKAAAAGVKKNPFG